MSLVVVPARSEHLGGVSGIYAAATRTPATFDLEGRPPEFWEQTLARTDEARGYVFLVALRDGAVAGYARSGRFRERAAYDTTVETGVYISQAQRGRGTGHALYAELLSRLEASRARLAVAGITEPNPASTRLHLAHGFAAVGTFHGVGVKLGRAWDVTFYERALRPAAQEASSPRNT